MKRLIAILSVFLFVFIASTAANAGTLTFWHAFNDEQSKVLDSLVSKYKEKYPSVDIQLRKFDSKVELRDELMKSDANSLPDIAAIDSAWQNELRNADKLLPVDDQILKSVRIALKMDTYSPLWKASEFDGKLWTLPYVAYNYALVYDSDALAAKGIKAPPTNRNQIFNYAKKLTEPEKGIYGFYIPAGKTVEIAYVFNIFLAQISPEDQKLDVTGLDGVNAEKILYYLDDLLNVYKYAQCEDPVKSPMFIGSLEDVANIYETRPNLKAVNWAGKNKVGNTVLTNLALMKKANSDPENTWFFMYYLAEFPQLQKFVLASPVFPANKQVALSPEFFDFLEKYPVFRTYLTLMGKYPVKPAIDNHENVINVHGGAINKVLVEKKSVQSSLKESMDVINSHVKPSVTPSQPTGANPNKY